ncbi:MAG TPA: hypothetical protein VNF50_10615 [Acidimicrobiales bacterium]|nr:hypothetical protein [Acidimicrobiales bacterium]
MSVAAAVKGFVDALPTGSFVDATDVPGEGAARDLALSRMAATRPDVMPVRKGLYWKAPMSRWGPVGPDPVEVAMRILAGRGAGPTGWGASNYLGLSTQVPAKADLVAVGRVPKGLPASIRVHSRSNLRRLHLTPVEVATLEVLRNMPRYTEADLGATAIRLADLVRSGHIRPAALDDVVRHDRHAGLRERWSTLKDSLLAAA